MSNRENIMKRRGWAVRYKDGSVIAEWKFGKPFSHLPKQQEIVDVGLFYGDKHWFISGQKNYFAEKTESMVLGLGNSGGYRVLEARHIGFWDDEGRKIRLTLNERTGEVTGPYVMEG